MIDARGVRGPENRVARTDLGAHSPGRSAAEVPNVVVNVAVRLVVSGRLVMENVPAATARGAGMTARAAMVSVVRVIDPHVTVVRGVSVNAETVCAAMTGRGSPVRQR